VLPINRDSTVGHLPVGTQYEFRGGVQVVDIAQKAFAQYAKILSVREQTEMAHLKCGMLTMKHDKSQIYQVK